MRKFKLKIQYPGCRLKIGEIIEQTKDGKYYIGENGLYLKECVEDYPEFWEEIIEKNYEILTFIKKSNSEVTNVKDYDNISGGYLYCFANDCFNGKKDTVEYINHHYEIHSVKRLSDNVVFSIGDIVQLNDMWGYNCKIKEINIYNNEVAFNIQDKVASASYREFEKFKKVKPVLFKTEDGVDIYKGDNYLQINSHFEATECIAFDITNYSKSLILFSTKEKAKEYILYNKPCLSLEDIANVWSQLSGNTTKSIKQKSVLFQWLTNKVKSKL